MRSDGRSRILLLAVAVIAVIAVTATVVALVHARTKAAQPGENGRDVSAAVTAADGAVLQLGTSGAVRIPPGAVDRDGVLRVRRDDPSAPPVREGFLPHGPSLRIELDGAALVGEAIIEFPMNPEAIDESTGPLIPVGMFLDETSGRWTAAESPQYNAVEKRLSVRTKHFSLWQAFTFDWDWARRAATGLLEGTLINELAGATRPNCTRETAANNRVRRYVTAGNPLTSSPIPGGDHLLWCLDLDDADQLLLRVANNRRMAIQVKMFAGLELMPATVPRPLAIKYVGRIADEFLNAQDGIRAIVLGYQEQAVFRVNNPSPRAWIGTAPSGASFATDVIDIGVNLLALTFSTAGEAARSAPSMYELLFEKFDTGNCISGGLHDRSVLADPAEIQAVTRSVVELVIGCVGETLARALPALAGSALHVAAIVVNSLRILVDTINATMGSLQLLGDIAAGRWNYFVILEALPKEAPTTVVRPGPVAQSPGTSPITPPPVAQSPPPPVVQPALTNIVIKRVWTRNNYGNDQSDFACGDQVRLSLFVENPNSEGISTEIDFLVEAAGQRLYYLEKTITVPPGLANYESVFNLPTDVSGSGTYIADVFPKPDGLIPSDDSTSFSINCAQ